jgi:hypothetical protein
MRVENTAAAAAAKAFGSTQKMKAQRDGDKK